MGYTLALSEIEAAARTGMRRGNKARALAERSWSGKVSRTIGRAMDRISKLTAPIVAAGALAALALPALALANPPGAAPSGRLATLPIGTYECTLPGKADGPAWHRIPDHDFAILNSSSYEARGQRGVYLMRGTEVTFTRGPLKGTRMERSGKRMLRERMDDGSLGRMRCVRTGPAA